MNKSKLATQRHLDDVRRDLADAIPTQDGRKMWPLNPRIEDIDIRDIAMSLSGKARWGGFTRPPYYVSQHSVLVAQVLPSHLQLWGLLHDAGEAYLPDIPRPIKRRYPELVAAEERILKLVAERYELVWPMPAEVHEADDLLLVTEARDLMHATDHAGIWSNLPRMRPLQITIEPWSFVRAESEFLAAFKRLYKQAPDEPE